MQEARILINGIAVNSTGMSDFRYTKFGTIQGFTYKGIIYRYCINKISPGYYDFNRYLDFIASNPRPDPKTLVAYVFAPASENDIITIRRREISADFNNVCWYKYTFLHKIGRSFGDYENIELPEDAELVEDSNSCIHQWEVAKEFYDDFIHKAKGTNDAEYAEILADIQQYIENLEENIFSILDANPKYNPYIVSQRNLWRDSVTYDYPKKQDYVRLLSSMKIFSLYFQSYQKRFNDDDTLVFIHFASIFEPKAIEHLPLYIKMDMLSRLANRSMDNWQLFYNPEDDQSVVIKILQSINAQDADEFLSEMVDPSCHYVSMDTNLFLALYAGLDNSHFGIGKTNLHDFVFEMYNIWRVSSYNPYQNEVFNLTNFQRYTYNKKLGCSPGDDSFWSTIGLDERTLYYDAAPFSLNYTSTAFIGYYLDDFKFYFSNGNDASEFSYDMRFFKNTFPPSNKILVVDDNYRGTGSKGLSGTYDYYQPVSLIDSNQQAAVKIPVINGNDQAVVEGHKENINNLIPVFVLKYIDDFGDRSDLFKTIGYFVDIVSLLAGGSGLATKLSYLRNLSGFTEAIVEGTEFGKVTLVTLYASAAIDTITLASASVSFLLKLTADIYKDQPWYKKLVTVVTWIELLSASGSVLADKLLKTSAKNLVDEFGSNWPAEFETDSRGAEARQTLNDIAGVATVPISEMFESYKKEVETELKRLEKLEELGTFSSTNPNGTPRHSPEIMTELLELAYKKETPVSEIAALIHISYKNRKLIESEQLLLQVKYFINVTKLKGYPAGFASLEKYEDFCNAVKTELNNILVKFGESYNADFRSIQFELKIQGSSLRKRFLTDPFPEGVDPSDYVGLDVPGDIEFGIFMDEENFESFVRELGNARAKAKGQGKLNSKLGSAINYAGKQSEISNNFLMYIPTEQGNALDAIKNAGFQHITGLPSAADVNFKFFKSGATGGLEPLLEFKY